jgi:hypothetical protein
VHYAWLGSGRCTAPWIGGGWCISLGLAVHDPQVGSALVGRWAANSLGSAVHCPRVGDGGWTMQCARLGGRRCIPLGSVVQCSQVGRGWCTALLWEVLVAMPLYGRWVMHYLGPTVHYTRLGGG